MLKRIAIALTTMIVLASLFGFVKINHITPMPEMNDDDFKYYTTVSARSESTESTTIYISYRTVNGGRKYYYSFSDPRGTYAVMQYGHILKNRLYQSSTCTDFRRNYRYQGDTYQPLYFNCNLPYFKE